MFMAMIISEDYIIIFNIIFLEVFVTKAFDRDRKALNELEKSCLIGEFDQIFLNKTNFFRKISFEAIFYHPT